MGGESVGAVGGGGGGGGGGAVGDGGWFVPGACAWDVLLEAAAEAEATSREHAAGNGGGGVYAHPHATTPSFISDSPMTLVRSISLSSHVERK